MSLNRTLDRSVLDEYRDALQHLTELEPELMAGRLPEYQLQHAFVFHHLMTLAADRPGPLFLCAGAFEDATCAALKAKGYLVKGVDPALGQDLETLHRTRPALHGSYDFAFSVSVLEHVLDDGSFAGQLADFLAPGGIAILTCDYNDRAITERNVPPENYRFYSRQDLVARVLPRMRGCTLVDTPAWDPESQPFRRGTSIHGLAALVVRKEAVD